MFDLSIPFPSRNFLVLRALSGTSIYRSAFRRCICRGGEPGGCDSRAMQKRAEHRKYLLCDERTSALAKGKQRRRYGNNDMKKPFVMKYAGAFHLQYSVFLFVTMGITIIVNCFTHFGP